jgi:hypothetical protein
MNPRLAGPLSHPSVWLAAGSQETGYATISTGFADLDQRLPGHGWPTCGLVDLLVDGCGGELSLFMPALAQLGVSHPQSWIAWISPPYEPHPIALEQHGINVQRMLIVRGREVLWSMEQALLSGCCRVVLGWIETESLRSVSGKALRRLQLAAEQNSALCLLFRTRRFLNQTTPAVLRLLIVRAAHGIAVDLIKARGVSPGRVELGRIELRATGCAEIERNAQNSHQQPGQRSSMAAVASPGC